MNIIKQRLGKVLKQGKRVYIDDRKLEEVGLIPGAKYVADIDKEKHRIEIQPSELGMYVVSSKSRKLKSGEVTIPVVDKENLDIKSALEDCTSVKITFVKDEDGGRVIIEGIKKTADSVKTKSDGDRKQLTSITFCAGSGISSQCNKDVGFKELAACEFNPKGGADDRFSDIYTTNHSDTVMFNLPMQLLKADDLPSADFWLATLDCTDFSKAKRHGDNQTMHLFIHLMRLFYEKRPEDRPKAILIENVPEFANIPANSLRLCLEEEGYEVKEAKINSLDFNSRTQRERYFFFASCFEGFEFPLGTGRVEIPIAEDGVITLDSLEWISPEEDKTLKYFLERTKKIEKGELKNFNFKMSTIDITRDTYVGTITKTHHKKRAENIIKHPDKELYTWLDKEEHLRYLHSIDETYYLGDSKTAIIESIGQSVCAKTFTAIVEKVYKFLNDKVSELVKKTEVQYVADTTNQLCMCF